MLVVVVELVKTLVVKVQADLVAEEMELDTMIQEIMEQRILVAAVAVDQCLRLAEQVAQE
tara:strand:- start:51 stop:230 length:180 start_codon:yes stop_codon:yes gene_type:complete